MTKENNSLYEQAILDTEAVKKAIEQNAVRKVMEKIQPAIKQMIAEKTNQMSEASTPPTSSTPATSSSPSTPAPTTTSTPPSSTPAVPSESVEDEEYKINNESLKTLLQLVEKEDNRDVYKDLSEKFDKLQNASKKLALVRMLNENDTRERLQLGKLALNILKKINNLNESLSKVDSRDNRTISISKQMVSLKKEIFEMFSNKKMKVLNEEQLVLTLPLPAGMDTSQFTTATPQVSVSQDDAGTDVGATGDAAMPPDDMGGDMTGAGDMGAPGADMGAPVTPPPPSTPGTEAPPPPPPEEPTAPPPEDESTDLAALEAALAETMDFGKEDDEEVQNEGKEKENAGLQDKDPEKDKWEKGSAVTKPFKQPPEPKVNEAASFDDGEEGSEKPNQLDEDDVLEISEDELKESLMQLKAQIAKKHLAESRTTPVAKSLNETTLKNKLSEYHKSLQQMTTLILQENLKNAKLQLANRLFVEHSLTSKQKEYITECLNFAQNVEQAKVVYNKLKKGIDTKRKLAEGRDERLAGSGSAATGSSSLLSENIDLDRWQELSGINRKGQR